MRDILLKMENASYCEKLTPVQICESLTQYSQDDIHYAISKLNEAGFIQVEARELDGYVLVFSLCDITYEGHQFLANIHTNKVWETTKNIGTKIGSTSIHTLTQIAAGVITALIKSELGL